MSSRTFSYRARRVHRYLGVFIGIQFVLWTVGGLYFSWTDLDEVHGDHLIDTPPALGPDVPLATPARAIAELRAEGPVDSLASVELVRVLDGPAYRIGYFTREGGQVVKRTRLADAANGSLRQPISRGEAVTVARAALRDEAEPSRVELVTEETVGSHHEYRAQPLPAWAISFPGPESATLYVPVDLGRVQRVRNDRWRVFDFLWMLHTMDYRGRDDFNNIVLRVLSILGLATVMSGFTLFVLTSRPLRRAAFRRREAALRGSEATP